MRLSEISNIKHLRIALIIFVILILVYAFLRYFVLDADPLMPLVDSFFSYWLGLAELVTSQVIGFFRLEFLIENHVFYKGDEILYEINPQFLMRKWIAVLLLFIWVFPVGAKDKIIGTFIFLISHFLTIVTGMIILGTRASLPHVDGESAYWVARTPGVMVMTTFFVIWLLRYKTTIYNFLEKFKVDTVFIDKKLPDLFVIIYLSAFMSNYLLGWYDYLPWIDFLFTSSQKLLALLGYEAHVHLHFLIGDNGSIYMEKGCLGVGTMMLFAAMVYLTSEGNISRWIYILFGLVILNFVNILRFVFLFIHLQKNQGYALTLEVHDLYNLILYGVVFGLWVIWFEFFTFRKMESKKIST